MTPWPSFSCFSGIYDTLLVFWWESYEVFYDSLCSHRRSKFDSFVADLRILEKWGVALGSHPVWGLLDLFIITASHAVYLLIVTQTWIMNIQGHRQDCNLASLTEKQICRRVTCQYNTYNRYFTPNFLCHCWPSDSATFLASRVTGFQNSMPQTWNK